MVRAITRKNTSRRNTGGIGKVMLSFVAFLFGYLSACLVDLNQVGMWITANMGQSKNKPQVAVSSTPAIPKPKFEFYTLLANEKVARPDVVPSANKTSSTVVAESRVPAIPRLAPVTSAPNLAITEKLPLHEPLTASNLMQKNTEVAANVSKPFLVQIGSFRNMREAERMKASLVMKGFMVNINTAVQQKITWYRVTMGPFASKEQAQKAQLAFSHSEHIMGMIRKMDA